MRDAIPGLVSIVALISSLLSALLVRQSKKEEIATERKKVDAEAFQRARETYDDIIRTLEGQVERLKQDLADQIVQNQELRAALLKLENTVKLLKQCLSNAGIQTPPDID